MRIFSKIGAAFLILLLLTIVAMAEGINNKQQVGEGHDYGNVNKKAKQR